MNTLFDIGDGIEIRIRGVVNRYTSTKYGDDCIINLYPALHRPEGGTIAQISMSTNTLLDLHASKLADPVEGTPDGNEA